MGSKINNFWFLVRQKTQMLCGSLIYHFSLSLFFPFVFVLMSSCSFFISTHVLSVLFPYFMTNVLPRRFLCILTEFWWIDTTYSCLISSLVWFHKYLTTINLKYLSNLRIEKSVCKKLTFVVRCWFLNFRLMNIIPRFESDDLCNAYRI
jgi:hypothetical protein